MAETKEREWSGDLNAKASQVCFYRKFNSYDFFFTITPVPERCQSSTWAQEEC